MQRKAPPPPSFRTSVLGRVRRASNLHSGAYGPFGAGMCRREGRKEGGEKPALLYPTFGSTTFVPKRRDEALNTSQAAGSTFVKSSGPGFFLEFLAQFVLEKKHTTREGPTFRTYPHQAC